MRTRGTYAQPFRSFTEEPEGRAFVPTALHEDIQDVPVLINGTPQIMPLAVDLQKHLVAVPRVARLGTARTGNREGCLILDRCSIGCSTHTYPER
jgi:hypothetical protein